MWPGVLPVDLELVRTARLIAVIAIVAPVLLVIAGYLVTRSLPSSPPVGYSAGVPISVLFVIGLVQLATMAAGWAGFLAGSAMKPTQPPVPTMMEAGIVRHDLP
jgi:tetrahydromethanopterin S-methyltransferase subunit D